VTRRLTNAELLSSWRLDCELSGGHTVAQTCQFVAALMDVDEERRGLPANVISPDGIEPRWLSRVRGWFGH